jgi:hypothetical protein
MQGDVKVEGTTTESCNLSQSRSREASDARGGLQHNTTAACIDRLQLGFHGFFRFLLKGSLNSGFFRNIPEGAFVPGQTYVKKKSGIW